MTTARATAPATSSTSQASGGTAIGSRSPSRGTAIIYGRSDSTINRQGVRMGTSEIYRAVAAVDEVVDALVVDLPREGTEGWMPLFVVLARGCRARRRPARQDQGEHPRHCSPRHVPNEIIQIAEVPRTLSGKVLEVPGKAHSHGNSGREGGQPRLAGQPGRARLVLEARAELALAVGNIGYGAGDELHVQPPRLRANRHDQAAGRLRRRYRRGRRTGSRASRPRRRSQPLT